MEKREREEGFRETGRKGNKGGRRETLRVLIVIIRVWLDGCVERRE